MNKLKAKYLLLNEINENINLLVSDLTNKVSKELLPKTLDIAEFKLDALLAYDVSNDDASTDTNSNDAKVVASINTAATASTAASTNRQQNKGLTLFTYYVKIDHIINSITVIIDKLESLEISGIEISESAKSRIKTDVINLRKAFNTFKKESMQIDITLIPKLSKELADNCINDNTILFKIRKEIHKNFSGVELYANVMQLLIDHYYTIDKLYTFQLMKYLEDDKSLVLNNPGLKKVKNKTIIKTNPSQTRFGLIPVTVSQPLDICIGKIEQNLNKTTKHKSLKKVADALDISIIVFNHIVYNPIEYNIRSLILEDDAKQYVQPKEFGITDKVVKRFQTIIATEKPTDWKFSIEFYNIDDADDVSKSNKSDQPDGVSKSNKSDQPDGVSKSNKSDQPDGVSQLSKTVSIDSTKKFYILETLNGTTYRFLAPWLSNNIALARFRVEHILNYDPTKPSRATSYHFNATNLAVQNMFLPKALEMESFENQTTDVASGVIQQELIEQTMRYIDNLIAKKYAKGIKSSIEINDILHDPGLMQHFNRELVKLYKKGSASPDVNEFDAGSFPFYEVLSSFIVNLQIASRRFSREIHTGYSRTPLRPEAFTQHDAASIIRTKILTVVQEAISLIIKLDENLYTSLHYKYLILNFTT